MRVLITGGAGFIGSKLADRLLARGDEVLVIDDLTTGRRDNVAEHPRQRFVEASITDEALVRKLTAEFKPDRVVHAAASYADADNWQRDSMVNCLGTAIVVKAAKEHGVKRLIYFQTSLCYGPKPTEQPVTLTHPLWPNTSYAISKTAGEQYIAMSGLDFLSFRLANMFGPRNLSGPVPTFYKRLTAGQPCVIMDARRDFMYIEDMLDVVVGGLDGRGTSGVYHISSGRDWSIQELFDGVVAAMGIALKEPPPVRQRGPDDVATLLLDPAKTARDFGWKSSTPIEAGIKAAVEWYRTHGVTNTYTHLRIEGHQKV